MGTNIGWYYHAGRAWAQGKKITPTQRLIMQRSSLTHYEHQFGPRHDYISFSATMMDGDQGCRFKDIQYKHPDRWVPMILPMTDEQEDRAWDRALELNGKDYDLIGVGSLISGWRIIKPNPDRYWCNEAGGELLVAAYQWTDFKPDEWHPESMFFEVYKRLQEMMFKFSRADATLEISEAIADTYFLKEQEKRCEQ